MELKKRSDIPLEETWNLQDLFATEAQYRETLVAIGEDLKELDKLDLTTLDDNELIQSMKRYENILIALQRAENYQSLSMAEDISNPDNQKRAAEFDLIMTQYRERLIHFEIALKRLPQPRLQALAQGQAYPVFWQDILDFLPHQLSDEAEESLSALESLQALPYQLYLQAKLADLQFEPFSVKGQEYALSFVLYENHYQYHPDQDVRREAFLAFSEGLKKYQHSIATAYIAQVQKEKQLAQLRGFESVFDYLLFSQKIPRHIYDKHLDCFMEKLSGVMQKYARHLADVHGINDLHFCDLKLPIDPDYSPSVSMDEAKDFARRALAIMGDEYQSIVQRALDERWIDWAQNIGKSTGGFCTSPYGVHGYVLLSWTGLLSEVFTLVHELGHVGHFEYANQAQTMLQVEPSLYFIEAPSTINELLLARLLLKEAQDPRAQRFVISSLLGNTYYHNCVTHFLEAWFQREVYRLVDRREALTLQTLHELKKETLKKFWGDTVVIDDHASLTWMRQPHYYMELYPYTYSAGLSIATAMVSRFDEEGGVEAWIKALKAGGTLDPVALAATAGVDLTKTDFLEETIEFIDSLVDKSIAITQSLGL